MATITMVEPIANGQTDLDGNRLVFIPSAWAPGYFVVYRAPTYTFSQENLDQSQEVPKG